MSKKKIITIIITSIVIILGLGTILLYKGCSDPFSENDESILNDSVINKETLKIDSLKKEIEIKERIISRLKDSIRTKEIVRTIEINNIKKLPLDSSVMFLRLKLREYENKY